MWCFLCISVAESVSYINIQSHSGKICGTPCIDFYSFVLISVVVIFNY
jgi:hypothetical protein